MRYSLLVFSFLFCACVFAADQAPPADQQKKDEAAIRQGVDAFNTAWNKHDVGSLSAMFAKDGDAMSAGGLYASGRDNIEKLLQKVQSGMMRDASVQVAIRQIRFLTPDLALVDINNLVRGMRTLEGKELPPMAGRVVAIMQKQPDGKWEIAASRPTPLLPARKLEQPTPTGVPGAKQQQQVPR